MRWIEVDLLHRPTKNCVNVARVAVCGSAEIWHRFRDITHEAVECHLRCTECGDNNNNNGDEYVTIDYAFVGKRMRSGRYAKQYTPKKTVRINKNNSQDPTLLTLHDVRQLYQSTWSDYTGSDYSITACNCKDFAQIYWESLLRENETGVEVEENQIISESGSENDKRPLSSPLPLPLAAAASSE